MFPITQNFQGTGIRRIPIFVHDAPERLASEQPLRDQCLELHAHQRRRCGESVGIERHTALRTQCSELFQ